MFGRKWISHQDKDDCAGTVHQRPVRKIYGGIAMAEDKRSTWPGTDYQSQIYHDPNQKGPKRE